MVGGPSPALWNCWDGLLQERIQYFWIVSLPLLGLGLAPRWDYAVWIDRDFPLGFRARLAEPLLVLVNRVRICCRDGCSFHLNSCSVYSDDTKRKTTMCFAIMIVLAT